MRIRMVRRRWPAYVWKGGLPLVLHQFDHDFVRIGEGPGAQGAEGRAGRLQVRGDQPFGVLHALHVQGHEG